MYLEENKQEVTTLLPEVGELEQSGEKLAAGTKHLWTKVKYIIRLECFYMTKKGPRKTSYTQDAGPLQRLYRLSKRHLLTQVFNVPRRNFLS